MYDGTMWPRLTNDHDQFCFAFEKKARELCYGKSGKISSESFRSKTKKTSLKTQAATKFSWIQAADVLKLVSMYLKRMKLYYG
ncbi:hypothetical protein TNCT_104691 [Trichonephila clavata]|uniref:Uncharacterized protein n=1 Tax=Trichonephila clavata TaxID=2740835 RepID=A0A8X6L4E0_TRICU|nr:hypothetical protein TNCT_104691 [Trichonephila clavata]